MKNSSFPPWSVAFGTIEQITYLIIKKAFKKRGINKDPLLAHSFERVMPGRNNVASVRDFSGYAVGSQFSTVPYFEMGCEVKGLGRGHVKRIKDEVRMRESED